MRSFLGTAENACQHNKSIDAWVSVTLIYTYILYIDNLQQNLSCVDSDSALIDNISKMNCCADNIRVFKCHSDAKLACIAGVRHSVLLPEHFSQYFIPPEVWRHHPDYLMPWNSVPQTAAASRLLSVIGLCSCFDAANREGLLSQLYVASGDRGRLMSYFSFPSMASHDFLK